jgi:HAD superfamily hydrolase (TIGR01549 family)
LIVKKPGETQIDEQQAKWGIFFDLDGVIVHSKARNFIYYVDVFKAAGLNPPSPDAIARCYPLGFEEAIAELTPSEDASLIPHIIEAAKNVRRHADLLSFPEYITEHFEDMRDDNSALAIITNAPPDSVHEVFDAYPGLEMNFDAVITDAEKPSPRGILAAMEAVEVTADSTVLIGDTAHTDGEAARNAGIKFIHYTNGEFDPMADARVNPRINDSQFSLRGLTLAVREMRALTSF